MTERVNNMPKISQQVSGKAKFPTQSGSRSLVICIIIKLCFPKAKEKLSNNNRLKFSHSQKEPEYLKESIFSYHVKYDVKLSNRS